MPTPCPARTPHLTVAPAAVGLALLWAWTSVGCVEETTETKPGTPETKPDAPAARAGRTSTKAQPLSVLSLRHPLI